MVLGFAVAAVFAVAVLSTIVATVNEMKKPPAPEHLPSAFDIANEVPSPLAYRFSYQTVNPNISYTRHSLHDERFEVHEEDAVQTDFTVRLHASLDLSSSTAAAVDRQTTTTTPASHLSNRNNRSNHSSRRRISSQREDRSTITRRTWISKCCCSS